MTEELVTQTVDNYTFTYSDGTIKYDKWYWDGACWIWRRKQTPKERPTLKERYDSLKKELDSTLEQAEKLTKQAQEMSRELDWLEGELEYEAQDKEKE